MSQNFPTFDRSVGGNQTAPGIAAPAVITPQRCTLYTIDVVAPGAERTLVIGELLGLAF
jgi:hypothetical protein